MEKPQPTNEEPLTDSDLINRSIERATQQAQPIDHATARVIASQLHDGQTSAMYSLASTGALSSRLLDEIDAEIRRATAEDDVELRTWMDQLYGYIQTRETADPVAGWSSLWLNHDGSDDELDDDDRCPACSAHIAEPHSMGCPVGEEEL